MGGSLHVHPGPESPGAIRACTPPVIYEPLMPEECNGVQLCPSEQCYGRPKTDRVLDNGHCWTCMYNAKSHAEAAERRASKKSGY